MKKSIIFGAVLLQIVVFSIAIQYPSVFIPLACVEAIYLLACSIMTWKLHKTGEISNKELPHIVLILLACIVMLFLQNNIITLVEEMMAE